MSCYVTLAQEVCWNANKDQATGSLVWFEKLFDLLEVNFISELLQIALHQLHLVQVSADAMLMQRNQTVHR